MLTELIEKSKAKNKKTTPADFCGKTWSATRAHIQKWLLAHHKRLGAAINPELEKELLLQSEEAAAEGGTSTTGGAAAGANGTIQDAQLKKMFQEQWHAASRAESWMDLHDHAGVQD